MARPQMMDDAMTELLSLVADGGLQPVIGGRYPLSAVREAHQDLRSPAAPPASSSSTLLADPQVAQLSPGRRGVLA